MASFDGDHSIDLFQGRNTSLTLKKLDELIDSIQGGPSCLFMNKAMIRKVSDLVRAAGQATEVVTDQFGRRLNAYAGVPMEAIEVDNEYNPILGFTETGSTSSIYAVRFGVDGCHGFQSGPIKVLPVQDVNVWKQVDIEWYPSGPVLRHPQCAARLKGIVAG